MPPDLILSAEVVNAVFDESFRGIPRKSLESEWRAYRSTLRTDLELVLEDR
jgi:hypothetical protein